MLGRPDDLREATIDAVHDRAREVFLRYVLVHAMGRADDQRRVLQAKTIEQTADGVVDGLIDAQHRAGGMPDALGFRRRPEEMSRTMRFAEDDGREIPVAQPEHPASQLTAAARCGDSQVAHSCELAPRLPNRYFRPERILAESPADVCGEFGRRGAEPGHPVVRAPVGDLESP